MSDGHRTTWLAWLLIGLAAFALPLATSEYMQFIINLVLIYSLVSLGFNIVLGYLGQIAFANAALFGIGAYAFAIISERLALPFWLAGPIAGLVAALAGMIISLPALRLSRFYLAIVTLAFGELLRWIYIHNDQWTGGSTGLAVQPPVLFGEVLERDQQKYFIILFCVAALYAMTWNLMRSRFGRALAGVRMNEFAAASLGVSAARVKLIAFGWSGLLVGTAGALFGLSIGRISPASFDLHQLLLHFSIVAVGGFGSLLGSFLGALLLTAAPELLRNVPGAEEILFSVILILVMLFLPGGLGGLLGARFPALRDRFYR